MSREIKFRVWCGKEMHYKFNLHQTEKGIICATQKGGMIFQKGNNIMQYTGLKDKNGKEIYEGDVIKIEAETRGNYNLGDEGFSYRLIGIVKYMPSKGFYLHITKKWDLDNDEEIKVTNKIGYITQYLSEVIGNIYQDPKLLNNE